MYRLRVQGSPRAMGLAHGEELRVPIHELAAIRHALVRRRMPQWSAEGIDALASRQVDALARHPSLYDEFRGIADGSGLSLPALMVLNNYTDLRDFDSSQEGCSTFSIRSASHDVCGQTWDMHASARPFVLHLSRMGGDRAEVLTLTGCPALAGVNAHNVGVFINNLNCTQTGNGLMWPGLVQRMLLEPSASRAVDMLREQLPCSGHNYLVCGDDTVINVETTGAQLDVTFQASHGATFHTNHYLGRLQAHERVDRRSATSEPRLEALRHYFARHDASAGDIDRVACMLCSTDGEDSICVPYSGDDASLTCGGILYDRVQRHGVVFAGAFDEQDHSPFQIPAP